MILFNCSIRTLACEPYEGTEPTPEPTPGTEWNQKRSRIGKGLEWRPSAELQKPHTPQFFCIQLTDNTHTYYTGSEAL